MGKQKVCTNTSDDSTIINYTSEFSNKNAIVKKLKFKQCYQSKLILFKNVTTSKTCIKNKLIYLKKFTDTPWSNKTEKIALESLKPDILCYNIETPNDKHDTHKSEKSSNREKKDINKKSNSPISDSHNHYFSYDYPNHMPKKSVHTVESNISRERITWKTSQRRLLHSKLRPDTSNTSNILLPDLNYTLTTEKLSKPKYPKNVPTPAFKEVGSYKCKISVMTSKQRLLQRKKLEKEQKRLETLKEIERKENVDAIQQSKFLKQKENTQYDILFGKGLIKEDDDDKSLESQHKKKSAAKRLLERFQKVPSRSESEIESITSESSPINLFIEDDDDDSEIEEPEEESEEESEEDSEEESDEESKEELDEETNKIQLEVMEPEEKELLSEDYLNEPTKEEIKDEEKTIKTADKKETHQKTKNIKSIKPKIKNGLVIFKECDGKLCTSNKKVQVKVCEKLMLNIGTSISQERHRSVGTTTSPHVYSNTKTFPTGSQFSRKCPNFNHQPKTVPARNSKLPPNDVIQDLRIPICNLSEIIEHELQVISVNDQLSTKTKHLKKSAYDSKEKLYEKELQNYDYLTDRVSQTYQNLKPTDHKLLLDLNFQNKVTQTCRVRKKEKNMPTYNNFPSKQNALQVANQTDFKVIHKTPMGTNQWINPTTDMIYKNTKYIACPKYGKTIIPNENYQNKKHSYKNNNLQYNQPPNKNYRMSTYFVNVHEKPNDNLQHSLNLKTVDRNLLIKFV